MVSILTALYFSVLKSRDRVAVKPHASPLFHAMHYLMGRFDRASMENEDLVGPTYPSRTKE